MRKILFFLVLLTAVKTELFGQCKGCKKDVSVEYDVLNPNSKPGKIYVKHRGSVRITLKNLNPSLYNASINDSTITYSREVPELFTKAFTLPSLPTVPDATALVGGAANVVAGSVLNEDVFRDALLELYNNDFEKPARKLLLYSNIPDGLKRILNNCVKGGAQLTTEATTYVDGRLTDLSVHVNTAPADIKDKLEAEVARLKDLGEKIIKAADELTKNYNKKLAPELFVKKTVAEFQEEQKKVEELNKAIKDIKENTAKLLKEIEKFDASDCATDIVNTYNTFTDLEFNFSILKTIPKKADEMIFSVDIKRKSDKTCRAGETSFDIPVIVCGGVKIDFSTGIVFNIGKTYFFDQKYRFDSVYRSDNKLADSVQIKLNKNNNVVIPSLGAFMHIYSRNSTDLNIGGMLGVSVGTDERLYYHVGGSIFIGKEERVVINFGASGSKSKRLDGQYKVDQILKRDLSPAAISTEDPFRVGFFVGLSYNLNLIK
jgi:hypothetical protein